MENQNEIVKYNWLLFVDNGGQINTTIVDANLTNQHSEVFSLHDVIRLNNVFNKTQKPSVPFSKDQARDILENFRRSIISSFRNGGGNIQDVTISLFSTGDNVVVVNSNPIYSTDGMGLPINLVGIRGKISNMQKDPKEGVNMYAIKDNTGREYGWLTEAQIKAQ